MNFLFWLDPLASICPDKDTSYAFMLGAHRQGHQVFYLPSGGISLLNEEVLFQIEPVIPTGDPAHPFTRSTPGCLSDQEVDAIFVRKDPPFDTRYLMGTWLLDRVMDRVVVSNEPQGLRTVNEKLWVTQFTDLVPPTLVSCSRTHLEEFCRAQQEIVVKPTDGFGGRGVLVVQTGDLNAPAIFETLTDGWTREIIAQQYLPQARQGDKRILLLDGEILGAVLRVHGDVDHRNNFMSGGTAHPAEVTARDRAVIARLKPHLQRLGLHFVGLDLIGDYLIEVNVTSPTCLQEMNRLDQVHLEDQVIRFVEKLVEQRRQGQSR